MHKINAAVAHHNFKLVVLLCRRERLLCMCTKWMAYLYMVRNWAKTNLAPLEMLPTSTLHSMESDLCFFVQSLGQSSASINAILCNIVHIDRQLG